jgi:serine/threonine protein kinase
MAPEVREDERYSDLSADVYSYGLMLWEMITGKSWPVKFCAILAARKAQAFAAWKAHVPEPVQLPEDFATPCNLSEDENAAVPPRAMALLRKCLAQTPQDRPTFQDIVWQIEQHPLDFFPPADLAPFHAYQQELDQIPNSPVNDTLLVLLRQLRNMLDIDNQIKRDLDPASPFIEKVLFCLGRLFGDGSRIDPDVMLIARYQFAAKHSLESGPFLAELDALEELPPGRPAFPLADFLMDPKLVDEELAVRVIPLKTRNDLFALLREILAGICCQHRYILKFHGWNVQHVDDQWQILIWTEKAWPFPWDKYGRLAEGFQQRFLGTAASGLAWAHKCGFFHNNLMNSESIQAQNGVSKICLFGLLDEHAGFQKDTEDFMDLFARAGGYQPIVFRRVPVDPDQPGETEVDADGYTRAPISFEVYLDDEICRGWEVEEGVLMPDPPKEFPFDPFFHLMRSDDVWTRKDGGVDVPAALAELSRGLDPSGIAKFKEAVERELASSGFLRPGFYK